MSSLTRRLPIVHGSGATPVVHDSGAEPFVRGAVPAGGTVPAVGRRTFLKWMAASLALASAPGCSRAPRGKILPWVDAPEEIVPGRPLFYASGIERDGFAHGVLVETHEGRPTKIDGHPTHPASLGACDAVTQAALLSLYDPDRSRTPLAHGRPATAAGLDAALVSALDRAGDGARIRIVTGPVTSPTLARLLDRFFAQRPAARHVRFESLPRDAAREGARLAFGAEVVPLLALEKAARVLALDADYLHAGPAAVANARAFARRRATPERVRMDAIESGVTVTGMAADHRLPLRPAEIARATRALAAALDVPAGGAAPGLSAGGAPLDDAAGRWIAAAARDLAAHPGESVVIAGDSLPAWAHALVHACNVRLGAPGATLRWIAPVEHAWPGAEDPVTTLAADLDAGRVDLLLLLDVNPAYEAPADLDFARRIARAPLSIHLGLHADETAACATWHVPMAHDLERWGDARAFDGTVTLIQPMILPLWGGRTATEIVARLLGDPAPDAKTLLRSTWNADLAPAEWESAVRRGWRPQTAAPETPATLAPDLARMVAAATGADPAAGTLEVAFRPDPSIGAGRDANHPWLQELPKPFTHLTWDNAALIGPATARAQHVGTGDEIEMDLGGRRVRGAVLVAPGHAEDCVTLPLGYGRTRAGRVGNARGFDANRVRTAAAAWSAEGLRLRATGRRIPLAFATTSHGEAGEDEARSIPPAAALPAVAAPPSLLPDRPRAPHAWAMAIDLDACIGCNACVIACQAENNVATVGPEQVRLGRAMHWIRIDTYARGASTRPAFVHQPVPCMHCEHAPCELVCPVGATLHSPEGLNEMTYNRCIGTRYCSNNCPYKVRRFNFLHYSATSPLESLPKNPDVTVRERGVMEKCTYCVQRINAARTDAVAAGRPMADGDVVTACQQACPTHAITFGDLADPASAVSQLRRDRRHYALLEELGTRPRTTYLARVRDLDPAIEEAT